MRKILITLSLSLLLVSCVSGQFLKNAARCAPPVDVRVCPAGQPPFVTLNLNSMNANPPIFCVKPNDTVELRIVPAPTDIGTVVVVAKNFSDTWLIGTNSPDSEKIFVKVPGWVSSGDYDYGFISNTGKCADPRFRVG